MSLEIFDTHAHYNDSRFEDDRDEIIADIIHAGDIKYILNAGTDIESSEFSLALSEKYPFFYAACGIHPHDCSEIKDTEMTLSKLQELLSHKKAVAIGEIGFDFHYDFSDRKTQGKWFELQMQLAQKLNLPVIIHDREAHGACMEMIKAFPEVKGVFHSFSGSAESALELTKRGWYISFSGVITFKNANKIREVVRSIPMDKILIETDCPYLSPVPMRGKTNHSGYLKYTAQMAAELKEIPLDEFCKTTTLNACRLFGIKGEAI